MGLGILCFTRRVNRECYTPASVTVYNGAHVEF